MQDRGELPQRRFLLSTSRSHPDGNAPKRTRPLQSDRRCNGIQSRRPPKEVPTAGLVRTRWSVAPLNVEPGQMRSVDLDSGGTAHSPHQRLGSSTNTVRVACSLQSVTTPRKVMRWQGHGPCSRSNRLCSSVGYPLCDENPYWGRCSWYRSMMRSRVTLARIDAAAMW